MIWVSYAANPYFGVRWQATALQIAWPVFAHGIGMPALPGTHGHALTRTQGSRATQALTADRSTSPPGALRRPWLRKGIPPEGMEPPPQRQTLCFGLWQGRAGSGGLVQA